MSHNIDSIKISCLLYLDRPMQADLSDFLSDLTPSRKGEVLRELLENGWKKYKEENGVGLDPEDFAQLIIENNKKENRKKRTKAKTTARKANSPQPKPEPIHQKESNTKKEDREDGKEEGIKTIKNENEEVSNDKAAEQNDITSQYSEKSALSSIKSFSIEDLDEDDDDVVDPLARMKMKNS